MFFFYPLESFMVSSLTLKFFLSIFIFESGLRYASNIILLCVNIQFSENHFLKKLSFLHCVFFTLLSEVC